MNIASLAYIGGQEHKNDNRNYIEYFWCVSHCQTQTNIYEVVIEMNIRQLNVERRTDQIEEELRRVQVKIHFL